MFTWRFKPSSSTALFFFLHPPDLERNNLERIVVINRRVTSSPYTCAPLYTLLRVKQERVRHDSNFIPLICVEESFFNGVKENFFLSLSAPLPVELSFREENGSTRLENKQSHNFSPSTFPKLLSGFVLSFVTRATGRTSASISTLPSCDTGPHPSIFRRNIRSYAARFPFFSQVFSCSRDRDD